MEYSIDEAMSPELQEVVKRHALPTEAWRRSIVGFSNEVWLHENVVIKIYKNEKDMRTEQWWYATHHFSFMPQCLGMGEGYLILEKVPGKSLFFYWPEWSQEKREEIFARACKILHEIHGVDTSHFPKLLPDACIGVIGAGEIAWKEEILGRCVQSIEILRHRDCTLDLDRVEALIREKAETLDGVKKCLCYPDFHLDNLLYEEETDRLYLLDFEDLCLAPADYDLDTPLRMFAQPFLYANEIDDPRQKEGEFEGMERILCREVPECFTDGHWQLHRLLYAAAYDLRMLTRFPDHEMVTGRLLDTLQEMGL